MLTRFLPQLNTPNLHNAEPEPERHATWLELFFDLVFVVAVAELAHTFGDDLTVAGAVEYLVLFVPVWWVWITFSYYGDVFDAGDSVYPLASLLAMFGAVSVAVSVAVFLLAVALVHWSSPRAVPRQVLTARVVAAGVFLAVALFGTGLTDVAAGAVYGLTFLSLLAFESSRSGEGLGEFEAEL